VVPGRQSELLEILSKLVDLVDSVHRRPEKAVRVVELWTAVVEEAQVARDELASPHMPRSPMPEIEGVIPEQGSRDDGVVAGW
jgi:hypothetical protein